MNYLQKLKTRPDWYWLNDVSLTMLSRGYLREGIPQANLREEAIKRANQLVDTAERILNKKLPTVRLGMARGWVSPSSPVWSNFGNKRGLPISCNGSYMEDNMESILTANAEIGMMTKQGAGTSCYMNELRPEGAPISVGGKSHGPVHFARLLQESISVISQSNVRRGNCAIWLDVEHPDINEWLMMRSITDGVHHVIQHLSFGVCIGDKWMQEMLAEEKGGKKRLIMAKIIKRRRSSGYPYIFFKDTVNRAKPQVLKDKNIPIYASNLCSEIMLPSNAEESFVCNLSAVNLLFYDEWKNTPLVEEMIYFLDAIMSEYIEKTASIKFMERAHAFSKRWRALGLGVVGYHSYLQANNIAFESEKAREFNIAVHSYIGEMSHKASKAMAAEYGEPEGLKGYGVRHLCVNAIAPTTSSSIILGQISQSIEPWESNYFENDNAKGVFTMKNPVLEHVLDEKGKNTRETWLSILKNAGSVQHLDFLSDEEKSIFKTFIEIDPHEIIQQAGDRQRFIDQGQSINLKIDPNMNKRSNVDLIVQAWKCGVKSLYYHKSLNKAQELGRSNAAACQACEA